MQKAFGLVFVVTIEASLREMWIKRSAEEQIWKVSPQALNS